MKIFPLSLLSLSLLLFSSGFSFASPSSSHQTHTYRRIIDRVSSLDPIHAASVHASRCDALVYETLLEYDYFARPYSLRPALATSLPSISDDGLTYSFTINTNAFFFPDPCFAPNPTRPLTASDVVYSFKRLADAKLASSGYWIVEGRIKGIEEFREASKSQSPTDYSLNIPGLQAPTPDRLIITLSSPSPVFLWLLAMPYTSVVPHEAVTFYGEKFGDHPVGTGPYTLSSWRKNYAMHFSRNRSWRGWSSPDLFPNTSPNLLPYDEIFFPIIEDPSTQWLAFLSGNLDLQGEISRDHFDEVVTPNGSLSPKLASNGFSLAKMPTLEVSYIGINMEDPILGSNKKLRQALNAAFDSLRWQQYYQGRITPLNGPIPPSVEGFDSAPLPFGRGIEVAQKLLAEAGYPNGRDPSTGERLRLVLDVGRTSQDMRESTELLIAFMNRIGINLVPEYSNWPSFLKKISNRNSQLFRISWVGDYPDAENFLQLFFGPNQSPGPNRCNYSNPAFDDLYRQAMTAPLPRRLELYKAMQHIIQEDCPWIFISCSTAFSLSSPSLKNYIPHDFPYGMEKYYRHTK